MKAAKILISGLAIALLGGLLFTACGHHRGHFCNKDFPKRVLKHMDKKIAKLDLDAAQITKYEKIRGEVKKDLQAMQQRHLNAGRLVKAELDKKYPDMEVIVNIIGKNRQKRPQLFEKYSPLLLDFYNSLNTEQQQKVLEKIRDHADRFDCD